MLEHLDTTIAFSVVLLLLSLMITALVQMAVTLSGLRGRNLFWGVERLLRQVDPKLGPYAHEVADRLLRHPAITHTWLSRAVAIRPEELVRLLRDLATPETVPGQPQIDPWYRQVLRKVVPRRIRERSPPTCRTRLMRSAPTARSSTRSRCRTSRTWGSR